MAASSRQRFIQYIPYLESKGVHVELSPLFDDEHLKRIANSRPTSVGDVVKAYWRRIIRLLGSKNYDGIWIQYEVFPFLPDIMERFATLSAKPIVIDYDDAVFHLYDRHKNGAVRLILGHKMQMLLSRAAICVCGNDYIRNYVNNFCHNSITIPTVVDTLVYQASSKSHVGHLPLTVGWIGSPTTWHYLETQLPAIQAATRSRGALFRSIGGGPAARQVSDIQAQDWSEPREVQDIQSMDVGVMPLKDDDWAQGKCGYKLIQYMACGLPVIASPIGVNRDIVEHGVNGFLASTTAEWSEALGRLLDDPNLRQKMGIQGRERVERHYSLASQQGKLLDVFQSL
jgi:glycosyltransferase involved in cell wall biosynthesis